MVGSPSSISGVLGSSIVCSPSPLVSTKPNFGGVGTKYFDTSAVKPNLLYSSKMKSNPAPNLRLVG